MPLVPHPPVSRDPILDEQRLNSGGRPRDIRSEIDGVRPTQYKKISFHGIDLCSFTIICAYLRSYRARDYNSFIVVKNQQNFECDFDFK